MLSGVIGIQKWVEVMIFGERRTHRDERNLFLAHLPNSFLPSQVISFRKFFFPLFSLNSDIPVFISRDPHRPHTRIRSSHQSRRSG